MLYIVRKLIISPTE
uniref:Uncharacterized protein n=1 Tax=Anguilla anguilla TaxID=7936 RepID=A0A0E9XZS1_ANGAN